MARAVRHLPENCDGAAVVEFALVSPVLLMLLLGLFDIGHNLYTASILQGAVQRAARDSALEGSDSAVLDERVTQAVLTISPAAQVAFDRQSYSNFSDVGRPEDFSDLNNNNICDSGEPFEDVNGNRIWDADRGKQGGGGARDAVLYTVSVEYPRMLPVAGMLGFSSDYSMEVATVLRNQPWNTQSNAVTTGNCT